MIISENFNELIGTFLNFSVTQKILYLDNRYFDLNILGFKNRIPEIPYYF